MGNVTGTGRARIPGGRDGRRMLGVALVDRIGSGLWGATSVFYFTYVSHLGLGQVGTLVSAAGVAGIAGAPFGGRLADRLPLTRVLAAFQVLRALAAAGLLLTDDFTLLLLCSVAGGFGDRAAGVLTRLYGTRIAGSDRVRYQAVNRTVANAGWALGGLAAAAALGAGTTAVYPYMLLGDAASFVAAAVITLGCAEAGAAPVVVTGGAAGQETASAPQAVPVSPWRNRRYLAYVGTDGVLCLHDAVFKVGLSLWAVRATDAPHGLVPVLLVLNNVLVVALQVPLSRLGATTDRARSLLLPLCAAFAVGGAAMAAAAAGGPVLASAFLLLAAIAFTAAEMLQAVVSWELSVALAPPTAQGAYLGVHGLGQATQRAVGPLAATAAIAAGPAGWAVLGAAVAATCLVQHRLVRSPLAAAATPAPAGDASAGGVLHRPGDDHAADLVTP
ncbi:membrane protein [Streptomyces mashuensis]|uniref:Membrane protein n=1 Tax=Streptomyces mashuensis TaxID=33904 RepID=A0A919B6R6_9ACTN|nr:MFS transporter [Streptomyces mashuensis]GHF54954.1 membrane protein [Streptomyces mashuensis]